MDFPDKIDGLPVLHDKSPTSGRERPWAKMKAQNENLSRIYTMLSERPREAVPFDSHYYSTKAQRLEDCARMLVFDQIQPFDGGPVALQLAHMSSCRVRLCPVCAWRRSLKLSSQMRQILDRLLSGPECNTRFLFLTLTVRNCEGDEIKATIDRIMQAWRLLVNQRRFKRAVKGWYRALEVTHNVNKKSESYNTFHPHIHALLCVPQDYFSDHKNNFYIPRDEWLQMWRDAYDDQNITQVDVRKVYDKRNKEVVPKLRTVYGDDGPRLTELARSSYISQPNEAGKPLESVLSEITKYTLKLGDYIDPFDWEFSADTVAILDKALGNQRLIAFGGILRQIRAELQLDDPEDGDLVEVSSDEVVNGEHVGEISYVWRSGYAQYVFYK